MSNRSRGYNIPSLSRTFVCGFILPNYSVKSAVKAESKSDIPHPVKIIKITSRIPIIVCMLKIFHLKQIPISAIFLYSLFNFLSLAFDPL